MSSDGSYSFIHCDGIAAVIDRRSIGFRFGQAAIDMGFGSGSGSFIDQRL